MNAGMNDQELYALFIKEKNSKWLGLLLEKYTLVLLGVCMKYLRNQEDAKDAVQAVFESAIKKSQIHHVENFGGWLYKIAINECLMRLRKKGEAHAELTDRIQGIDASYLENESEKRESALLDLERNLQLLPAEQKECLERFYFHKQSYEKITEHTGYKLNQVKSFIQNGKRNLKLMYLKQKKND